MHPEPARILCTGVAVVSLALGGSAKVAGAVESAHLPDHPQAAEIPPELRIAGGTMARAAFTPEPPATALGESFTLHVRRHRGD